MNIHIPANAERLWTPRTIGLIGVVGIVTLLFIAIIPAALMSEDALTFIVVAAGFALAVSGTLGISQAKGFRSDRVFFAVILTIWIFLLLSEGIFVHIGSTSSAEAGGFGAGAYQQLAAWLLSFVALMLITLQHPRYVSQLFTGPFKWLSLFVLVTLISVPISVAPKYSLAWSLKLILVVLLLKAISSCLQSREDVIRVLRALLVGLLGVAVCRFATPFLQPGPAFKGGRLEMIASLSGYGGILLVLVMLNWKFKRNPLLFVVAVFAVVMMLLAGGKAGLLASVVALIVFFLSINRARHALAALLVLCFLFSIFVAFTPLGDYLQRYNQSGQATTLTGRVDLWKIIWPEIVARPIMGHGYQASRFLSAEVQGVFAEAGQTHNSLLEPLYNNGILGLLMIVMMNVVIVRNLFAAMKDHSDPVTHYLAAGSFAMYANLFVWGMFTAGPFGGQPNSPFIVFLTVFIISCFLKHQVTARAVPFEDRQAAVA
jgi:O-antigen ligase